MFLNPRKLLILFFSFSLFACSSTSNNDQNTLYASIGGQTGIDKIVDNFIAEIVKDKQIFPYFAKSSVSHFRAGFIEHMCTITGGPCRYNGDSMVDIHTGMNITEAHFNRVVELLIVAMEKADVTYPVQNRILAKLAPMRGEVIKR
ncbi:group I truncated hemoglobin [Thalassotalea sediminis]|uniref:group I truncated hemoglobin n=1 Tax=Thalassotalea sediminis TaxID=1759089 RepID=UPI002574595C|nr:group 1 truncated hemoglobin [Thalassotalea sediminis]